MRAAYVRTYRVVSMGQVLGSKYYGILCTFVLVCINFVILFLE